MAAKKAKDYSQLGLARGLIKQLAEHLDTTDSTLGLHELLGRLATLLERDFPEKFEMSVSAERQAKEIVEAIRSLEWAIDRWGIVAR